MRTMKKAIFLLAGLLTCFFFASAQDYQADDVLGVWLNEDEDAHVEIYKTGDEFFGKLIWLKNPIDEDTDKPKLDKENPDDALKSRPVWGLVILKDFEYDGDDEWDDGTIYDPKSGNTYSCYIRMIDEEKNKIKIRGYVGISLLGRTTYWTRVD